MPHSTAPRAFPVSLPRSGLTAVRDALEGLTDDELGALAIATNDCPQVAPGLLAWIDAACDWEVNRRVGRSYELLPPEAAIDPSEDEVSINAAITMLRASFASSDFAPAALNFFDVVLKLLTGDGRKRIKPGAALR